MGPFRSDLFGLRSPYIVALAVVGIAIMLALEIYWAAVVAGGLLAIACFYHNLIWRYSQCDKLIGGVPTASRAYILGFLALMIGYVLLSSSLLLGNVTIERLGGIVLTVGLTLTVFATKTLFDRISRGARLG